MIEVMNEPTRAELSAQIPLTRVVGQRDLSCLLKVDISCQAASISNGDRPVVVAPVDMDPEDATEFEDDPLLGELELFVRDGYLHALVYSDWSAPTELPIADAIHPTTQVKGWVSPEGLAEGWTITRSPRYLSKST